MMNAPQYSSPWTQPCSQRTGPSRAPRTIATGMVTGSPSAVSPTRNSPRLVPTAAASAVPTRIRVVAVITAPPPRGWRSSAPALLPASYAHDPSQADQPLDDQAHADDEQDLDRRDRGHHRRTLPLHVREDLDRQRRAAGTGEEERDVHVAERHHEREEQRRQETGSHQRDDDLPPCAEPRRAQGERGQL